MYLKKISEHERVDKFKGHHTQTHHKPLKTKDGGEKLLNASREKQYITSKATIIHMELVSH